MPVTETNSVVRKRYYAYTCRVEGCGWAWAHERGDMDDLCWKHKPIPCREPHCKRTMFEDQGYQAPVQFSETDGPYCVEHAVSNMVESIELGGREEAYRELLEETQRFVESELARLKAHEAVAPHDHGVFMIDALNTVGVVIDSNTNMQGLLRPLDPGSVE